MWIIQFLKRAPKVVFAGNYSQSKIVFKYSNKSYFTVKFSRSRTLQPGTSAFQLVANTKTTTTTSVQLDVINSANNQLFVLTVVALESETIRVQIDEKTPIKARYRIQDALQGEPKTTKYKHIHF